MTALPLSGETVLAPLGTTLAVGETVGFSALLREGAYPARPVEGEIAWSSSDPAILRVDAEGIVTAARIGTAVLSARALAWRTSVTLRVTRVGIARLGVYAPRARLAVADEVQLEAVAYDLFGGRLPGRLVSWSSSDPSVTDVSPVGRVAGCAPGSATIQAACGGRTADFAVKVVPASIAGVRLTPAGLRLAPGESGRVDAVAVNAMERAIPGVEVGWMTNDALVVRLERDGRITALRPGTARVWALAGGRRAALTVSVALPSRSGLPPPAPR
ncbi:MAG TPA: Ig-like domain-containing protein [Gemmatimonadales bacterium]|nr:Ig-like domain-containing protein [Gemmatimonadales bacterium]